ncbi:MAG TPA: hypothetical protein VJH03_14595 [Blastocatellia bacterium]|nr:hypothetical protein [Blastocatellia bacterium]
MRKRLVGAVLCMLVLPIGFSDSPSSKLTDSTPFSMVAQAGHTTGGNWCQCGTGGCACDPGEEPIVNAINPSDQSGGSSDQGAPPSADPPGGYDLGTGALMMLALLFTVWIKVRA